MKRCCEPRQSVKVGAILSDLKKFNRYDHVNPFSKQDEINIRSAAEDKDRVNRILNQDKS